MGWSIGEDSQWDRDIGYGVPALCDHPKCDKRIDRGLAYVCCDQEPFGGERGCGLFFCYDHVDSEHRCPRCSNGKPPYKHPKTDVREWIEHKLEDLSWAVWRKENPAEVDRLKAALATAPVRGECEEV